MPAELPAGLAGAVLGLSPSTLDTWGRCRRRYLLGNLLRLPRSDVGPGAELGTFTHDLLRLVHTTGTCRDEAHVADVLAAHGRADDEATLGYVERHRRRCPPVPESGTHEVSVVRFHRGGMFMANARLDAIWVHDGVVDVRDYKTGRPGVDRLADDPRARLQAWVVAERAAARGLAVEVRYEYLAPEVDEDPEPFLPDEEDLAAITGELVSTVAEIRAERTFAGVADAQVCRHCEYRSICADSAAPGDPSWNTPAVEQ